MRISYDLQVMGNEWHHAVGRLCMIILAVLLLASCNNDDESLSSGVTETYKVLVIVPEAQQSVYSRTADWALNNITKAQQGLQHKVKIELTWKNEYDSDLESYVTTVADDPEYVAIIGPTESVNARKIAPICSEKNKCLILPIATSTELQRIYAGSKAVWNLTQSDITQCEVLLTQAKLSECKKVELITSNDDYGNSFGDWFSYQATELGLTVDGITMYNSETELENAVKAQYGDRKYYEKALIFAPGQESDAVVFDETVGELKQTYSQGIFMFPMVLCSDMMNTTSLSDKLMNMRYEGIAPTANPETGFLSAYKEKFGDEPVNGEAHVYDAILLTAYALTAKTTDENLNDAILRVVDGREACSCSWLPSDMYNAFAMLRNGQLPDLEGVTGDWTFDEKTHASVLNTTYNHWILADGKYKTLEYLTTDGSGRTTSTMQSWDWQNTNTQTFSESQKDITYPALANNWAVVVATSDTWANYRHQADALAMYQLLKRHGYDDDHIILIMEDNLAYNEKNKHQGEVRVRMDGENLYHDVTVDYHINDISIDDLKKIMLGEKSSALPNVISSTANDNVIVFWCGHGNYNKLAWGSDNAISGSNVKDILQAMNDQGKYRKMMFSIDACYSGSIGEQCAGIPGVIFVSAANSSESSKADMKDTDMGIWLSNGFTRAFQEQIDENPAISLRDLYYVLARRTVGSHATIYNADFYGNLYHNTMEEYLGK